MFGTLALVVAGALTQAVGGAMQKHGVATTLPNLKLRDFLVGFWGVIGKLLANRLWLPGGVLGIAGAAMYLQAFAQADLSVVAPLSSLGSLFAVGIGVIWLGERMSAGEWLAATLIVLGAVMVGLDVADVTVGIPSRLAMWLLYGLVCGLCMVLLLARRVWPQWLPLELTLALSAALQFGVGNAMLKVGAELAQVASGPFSVFGTSSLAALGATAELWLFLVSNVCGFILVHTAYANGRFVVIGPVLSAGNTLTSISVGFLMMGEPPNGVRLLGISALVCGTCLLGYFHGRQVDVDSTNPAHDLLETEV